MRLRHPFGRPIVVVIFVALFVISAISSIWSAYVYYSTASNIQEQSSRDSKAKAIIKWYGDTNIIMAIVFLALAYFTWQGYRFMWKLIAYLGFLAIPLAALDVGFTGNIWPFAIYLILYLSWFTRDVRRFFQQT